MSFHFKDGWLRHELNARGLTSEQFAEISRPAVSRPTVNRVLRGLQVRESSAANIVAALAAIPKVRKLEEAAAIAS